MTSTDDPRWTKLSKKRQTELIEEHRETCDYPWWDFVHEDFKVTAADAGIRVDDITFSGFWSQGDGAAFAGAVDDWYKVLRDHGSLLLAHDYVPHQDWTFRSKTGCGNCMKFDEDMRTDDNPYDEDDEILQHECFALRNMSEDEAEDIKKWLYQRFADLANDLYRDLEAEYEYLTSDEQTVDWILNNLEDEEMAEDEENFV